jgi:hypothetical protein
MVQLTPPGSSCAIVFGTGMGSITDVVQGSVKGFHLVVEDMAAARAALTERGIELSDVDDMGGALAPECELPCTDRDATELGPTAQAAATHQLSQPRPTGRCMSSALGPLSWSSAMRFVRLPKSTGWLGAPARRGHMTHPNRDGPFVSGPS